MKLYYSKGACSLAVRIALHEMNLPCEYESVDLKTKVTESGANYFDINPKGSVPVLITDDTQTLTENPAIQQYLADQNKKNQLLPPIGDFKRYRVLEWMSYICSDVHKAFGPLFNSEISEEEKNKIFVPLLKKKLNILDKALAKNQYLVGDQYTLPDGYVFVMLRWAAHFKLLEEFVNLNRYFNELKMRPSIMAAMKEEQLQ